MLCPISVSVHRLLEVATTPSTWPLSLWWLPTAPSGTQPSQSQKNSWSRCSLASSLSAKSRKPLPCRRVCTSPTEGERQTDKLVSPSPHPAFDCSLSVVVYSLTPFCVFKGGMYMFIVIMCQHILHVDCTYTSADNDLSYRGNVSFFHFVLAKGCSVQSLYWTRTLI